MLILTSISKLAFPLCTVKGDLLLSEEVMHTKVKAQAHLAIKATLLTREPLIHPAEAEKAEVANWVSCH